MTGIKKVVFVLGMHRSGTSALAGVLHGLGITMGSSLLEADHTNPKGFYENQKVYYFNEIVLLPRLESTAFDIRFPFKFWPKEYLDEELISEGKKIIVSEYGEKDVFGLKEPRVSVLLPYWDLVMESIGLTPYYVIIVRSPYEVMLSLKEIYKIGERQAYLIWVSYYLSVFSNTAGKSRYILTYDQLLNDGLMVVDAVCDYVGIDCESVKKEKALGFIDKSLKHNTRKGDVAESDELKLADKFYAELSGVVKNGHGVDYNEKFEHIKNELSSIIQRNDIVIGNLDFEIARLGVDRQSLFRTAEQRLYEIERISNECDELFSVAEDRLKEIDRVSDERDTLLATAEKRLDEIDSLVIRYEEMYSVAETRNNEIQKLIEKISVLERDLTGTNEELSRITANFVYRVLKRLGVFS